MKSMTEPVIVDVTLDKPPARVFDLFARRITEWWPLETHSLGASDDLPPKMVVMEPHIDGRIYEISEDGVERQWGTVTAWDPGNHIAFTWHVGRAPQSATRVSVRFRQTDTGGTHLRLRHDDWHMLGDEAEEQREGYATGWPAMLNGQFLPFAATNG